MRTSILAFALLCCFQWPLFAATDVEIPEISYRTVDGRALWVAEDAAFTEDGGLRDDLFSDFSRHRFDRIRSTNGDECRIFAGSGPLEIFEPMSSPDALSSHSKAIVTGRVVAAKQGFYAENPGTLYAIEVSERLKWSDGVGGGPEVFLFMEKAAIHTSRGMICAMSAQSAPSLSVGDRVLFFSYRNPMDLAQRIFMVDARMQLVVESKSAVHVPPAFASGAAVPTFESLTERVRRSLARDARQVPQ